MRKIIISVIVGVLILVGVTNHASIAKALGFVFRSGQEQPTGTFAMKTSVSSTTETTLYSGLATTTLTMPTDIFDEVTVFEYANATTTHNSSLYLEVQASDDNVDFFTYDMTTIGPYQPAPTAIVASTTIALASTTMPFTFKPAIVNATTSKAFVIPLIPARFTRFIWTVASGTPSFRADGIQFWANVAGRIKTDH